MQLLASATDRLAETAAMTHPPLARTYAPRAFTPRLIDVRDAAWSDSTPRQIMITAPMDAPDPP
jgi:hypothetical protein